MTQQEKPYLSARTFMFSVQKGDDLLQALQGFCHHYQIRCGVIHALGAVERATFSVYDQKAKKYVKINLEKELYEDARKNLDAVLKVDPRNADARELLSKIPLRH